MSDLELVGTGKIMAHLMGRADASVIILAKPISKEDGGDGSTGMYVAVGGDPNDKLELLQALILMNKAVDRIHLRLADIL